MKNIDENLKNDESENLLFTKSIIDYNNNINTKNSIETTIEKINETNTKINIEKLRDLTRREMIIYLPTNSLDSKDTSIIIDYISSDMTNLYYKNKPITYISDNILENYFIEFFMYGTDYTELFLPDLKFNPILMYSKQTEEEYLLCLNKYLNLSFKDTTLSFDYITKNTITNMAYFKNRVDILKKYIHHSFICNDNPSVSNILNFELYNLDKELVETYLEYRAKYLLKYDTLLSLNFNDLQSQIDFMKSEI